MTPIEYTPEVMLIEDDKDDQYLAETAISEVMSGITLSTYTSAMEAQIHLLERCQQRMRLPNLVLIDLNMPQYTGAEFLQAVRSEKALNAMPIVVYTTSSSEQDILNCYRLGANSYQIKPLSYAETRSMFNITCQYWLNVVKPSPSLCYQD